MILTEGCLRDSPTSSDKRLRRKFGIPLTGIWVRERHRNRRTRQQSEVVHSHLLLHLPSRWRQSATIVLTAARQRSKRVYLAIVTLMNGSSHQSQDGCAGAPTFATLSVLTSMRRFQKTELWSSWQYSLENILIEKSKLPNRFGQEISIQNRGPRLRGVSAYPLKADIFSAKIDVLLVPIANIVASNWNQMRRRSKNASCSDTILARIGS
jgi:hypothetical protein